MTITLKVGLKDGKTPIEATIEGKDTESVIGEYTNLLERFPAGPTTPAKGKKVTPVEAPTEQPAEQSTEQATEPSIPATPASTKVANIQSARSDSKFSKAAIEMNDTAVMLAERLATCIPHFRDKSAIEIVQQLNYNKPLATMTPGELQEVVTSIRNTLGQYADNNPGAAAYLKVVEVIDNLKSGTDEEWGVARQAIATEVWGVLGTDENAFLMDAAKTFLQSRQASLRSIHAAAEMAKATEMAAIA